ncbi:unnamed protein product [Knipowitschia caucasica]
MTESKSSGKCTKLSLVVLSLWSLASLVTIVVWATAPDFKSAAQCRSDLRELTVQHEGSKVVCRKNHEALEEMVRAEREQQDSLRASILELTLRLNLTNHTLELSREENLVLISNISVLQDSVESLQQIQDNLTSQLALKEETIDMLQLNLTQAEHQTQTCFSLKEATEAQTRAAESQTKACQSSLGYLQRQLQKCKASESDAKRTTAPQSSGPTGSGPGLRPALVLVLVLHLLLPLHLLL